MKKAPAYVRVYQANGPFEAHHIAHWLERNDIHVKVHADLAGIAGGVPVHEAWPSLWVRSEDTERAEKDIRCYAGPQMVHPEWSCPNCGETNGPNFGSCWSCETLRP